MLTASLPEQPRFLQSMNEKIVSPIFLTLNLVMGIVTFNEVQIGVAIGGALFTLMANAPKAVIGLDFVVRYVRAGFRLQKEVAEPEDQDKPVEESEDEIFKAENPPTA